MAQNICLTSGSFSSRIGVFRSSGLLYSVEVDFSEMSLNLIDIPPRPSPDFWRNPWQIQRSLKDSPHNS